MLKKAKAKPARTRKVKSESPKVCLKKKRVHGKRVSLKKLSDAVIKDIDAVKQYMDALDQRMIDLDKAHKLQQDQIAEAKSKNSGVLYALESYLKHLDDLKGEKKGGA